MIKYILLELAQEKKFDAHHYSHLRVTVVRLSPGLHILVSDAGSKNTLRVAGKTDQNFYISENGKSCWSRTI